MAAHDDSRRGRPVRPRRWGRRRPLEDPEASAALTKKDVGYPYGVIWSVVPDPERIAGETLTQRLPGHAGHARHPADRRRSGMHLLVYQVAR